jgi:hypothetical protein
LVLESTVLAGNDFFKLIFKYMRYICYLLAVIKIVKDGLYKKQIAEILIMGMFVVLAVMGSGNKTLIFYFLILLAAKDVEKSRIIKITLFVQTAVMVLIISMSQIGILPDNIADADTRARHSLGFEWANTAPFFYFFMMMSYIYLRKEKLRVIEIIIMEAINYVFYILTDTRMSFALSSLMLVYVFLMKFYWQNRSDKIQKNKFLILAPAVMCIAAIGIHVFYNPDNNRWQSLNTLLSGRLKLGRDGIEKYGVSLFGTPIEWIGFGSNAPKGTYNYVDSSYVQIMLEYGIIFLAIIVVLYMYIMYMAVKEKDFYLQTMILFVVIFSITEPRLLHLAYNPFPFLAISYWGGQCEKGNVNLTKKMHGHVRLQMSRIGLKKRR